MTPYNLGRRYERLLLLAVPISLASMIILIVALAFTTQKDKIAARCYEYAEKILADNKDRMNDLWIKNKSGPTDNNQKDLLKLMYKWELLIKSPRIFDVECYKVISDSIDERYHVSPRELIKRFNQDATNLRRTPLTFYGLEIPDKPTLSVFGTSVKIDLLTFTWVLQLVLAPLLIIWLGSLRNTRYSESLLVGSSTVISDIFPHFVNLYPVDYSPRTTWSMVAFSYAIVRVILLLLTSA